MSMFSMDVLIAIACSFVLYMMLYPGNVLSLPSSESDDTVKEVTHAMLYSVMVVVLTPYMVKMASKYMVKPVANAFS